MFKKIKPYLPILLILLLSYWAIRPLLASGFFPIHDDTQVARIGQMALALKDGQFPVRWVKDLGYGYGYPIFNFYAPLAYYIGAFFSLIGFDVLVATKMMMGLGLVLGGITMYLFTSQFWGKLGGVIAAIGYLYLPYKAVNLYVRGAVAELWALAFLPLVFFGLWLVFKQKKTGVIVGSLGITLVILSHNLTALMLIPFFVLTALIGFILSSKKSLFIKRLFFLTLLGLSLSAFYWLPALTEMNLTQVQNQLGGGAYWKDHFVFIDQLWASPWGFAGSAPGRLDGMSFMIGKLCLFLASLVILITLSHRPQKREKVVAWLAGGLFLLAVFFTNQLSVSVWRLFSLMAYIQYPWRFLGFGGFFLALISGGIVLYLRRNSLLGYLPAFFIIISLIAINSRYFKPQYPISTTAKAYLENFNLKWLTSGISDEYLPKDFVNPLNENEVAWDRAIISPGANLSVLEDKTQILVIQAQSPKPTELLFNLAYFPGWQIFLDNQPVMPQIQAGRMKLAIPAGDHQIAAVFRNTQPRILGNFFSILGLVGLLFYAKIALWKQPK